jgi:GWxTD domain-containing protein
MKKKFIISFLIFCYALILASEQPANVQSYFFDNLKDEYHLASYFLSHQQKKFYKQLSEEDKWFYLNTFWRSNDLDPSTEKNEFVELLKARISFANSQFTHFTQGWNTDRGRIYIRYGEPFERLKLVTSQNAKYPQREYEIWKYRTDEYLTYIFLDLQQHGDYRLIFSENDPVEGLWPDWLNYLGDEFDEGLLY